MTRVQQGDQHRKEMGGSPNLAYRLIELSTELSTRPNAWVTFAHRPEVLFLRRGGAMGWYENWFGTKYYASLYGHRDEEEAKVWVDAILDRWCPERGDQLLDIACGRGRHAKWFVKAGLKVTGIDISADSIHEAQKAVPGGRFEVHDMRTPFCKAQFETACCLFTSLGYTSGPGDDQKVFEAVAAALRPGGRFVLDFMNSRVAVRDLVEREVIVRDGVQYALNRSIKDNILVKHIQVTDGDEEHYYEERVQALRTEELESMALGAGLTIEDRTDGPVLSPFDPNRSPRFVLWMKKPSE